MPLCCRHEQASEVALRSKALGPFILKVDLLIADGVEDLMDFSRVGDLNFDGMGRPERVETKTSLQAVHHELGEARVALLVIDGNAR